ncbi:hypothetical protein DENSPDRAFT_496076 [Dentipellis sp. KUC8613]|nr:hypothetical protein DENSPDRAFT_496076 [Dentipellis sp. KUC8613]
MRNSMILGFRSAPHLEMRTLFSITITMEETKFQLPTDTDTTPSCSIPRGQHTITHRRGPDTSCTFGEGLLAETEVGLLEAIGLRPAAMVGCKFGQARTDNTMRPSMIMTSSIIDAPGTKNEHEENNYAKSADIDAANSLPLCSTTSNPVASESGRVRSRRRAAYRTDTTSFCLTRTYRQK